MFREFQYFLFLFATLFFVFLYFLGDREKFLPSKHLPGLTSKLNNEKDDKKSIYSNICK